MNEHHENHENAEEMALHIAQVRAVTAAVSKLSTNLAPIQFSPEAVLEGAVKGGAIALLAQADVTTDDVATVLDNLAQSFRELERPNLYVVQ